MMKNNKGLHIASFILVVVGALNWGLVGLFDFNLVDILLGEGGALSRIVYVLVGLAGVYLLVTHKQDCQACNPMGAHSSHGSTHNAPPTPPSSTS